MIFLSVSQVFKNEQVTVKRLGKILDVDTLVAPFLNKDLRGLGHSGWDNGGKNPTHIIKLSQNKDEGSIFLPRILSDLTVTAGGLINSQFPVKLQYKLLEVDGVWKPTHKFDPNLKTWVPFDFTGTRVYHIMNQAAPVHVVPLILCPSRDAAPDHEQVRRGIYECRLTHFPNWETFKDEWDVYFSNAEIYSGLSPWVPTSPRDVLLEPKASLQARNLSEI